MFSKKKKDCLAIFSPLTHELTDFITIYLLHAITLAGIRGRLLVLSELAIMAARSA